MPAKPQVHFDDPDEISIHFFTLSCPDDPFQKHLHICCNSGFTLFNDPVTRHVKIMDEAYCVLHAVPFADAWSVSLNPAYYPHPFVEERMQK